METNSLEKFDPYQAVMQRAEKDHPTHKKKKFSAKTIVRGFLMLVVFAVMVFITIFAIKHLSGKYESMDTWSFIWLIFTGRALWNSLLYPVMVASVAFVATLIILKKKR